jgi:hypothetical protein
MVATTGRYRIRETSSGGRRCLISESIGYDALETFSNSLQQRFPGARFEIISPPDRVGNALRGGGQFGPDSGTDFVLLHDEKIRSLSAFVQPPPPDSG